MSCAGSHTCPALMSKHLPGRAFVPMHMLVHVLQQFRLMSIRVVSLMGVSRTPIMKDILMSNECGDYSIGL